MEKSHQSDGIPVDASGGKTIDPTKNVLDLVEAERRRQDDLREAERRYFDAENRHVQELGALRAEYQQKLAAAESSRLDSIRQVDREDVNKTAAQALNAIQTLASTTATTADTLRNQVATTAQQAAQQRAIDTTEFNKRLSAVELALSEGKGKQTIADPQIERMSVMIEQLARSRDTGSGKIEGSQAVWGYVVGGVGLLIALAMLALRMSGAGP